MKLWTTHLTEDELRMLDGSGIWLEEGETTLPAQTFS